MELHPICNFFRVLYSEGCRDKIAATIGWPGSGNTCVHTLRPQILKRNICPHCYILLQFEKHFNVVFMFVTTIKSVRTSFSYDTLG